MDKKSNKIWATAAATLGIGVAAAAFYYFSKSDQADSQYTSESYLSVEMLEKIFTQIRSALQAQFNEMALQHRKQRRAETNLTEYIKKCREFEDSYRKLRKTKTIEVLQALDIDRELFITSIEYYLEQGNEIVKVLTNEASLAPYNKIPSTKKIDMMKFIKTMNDRINYINSETPALTLDVSCRLEILKTTNPEIEWSDLDARSAIENKVRDHVYEYYGIETEDLQAFLESWQKAPDSATKKKLFEVVVSNTKVVPL